MLEFLCKGMKNVLFAGMGKAFEQKVEVRKKENKYRKINRNRKSDCEILHQSD